MPGWKWNKDISRHARSQNCSFQASFLNKLKQRALNCNTGSPGSPADSGLVGLNDHVILIITWSSYNICNCDSLQWGSYIARGRWHWGRYTYTRAYRDIYILLLLLFPRTQKITPWNTMEYSSNSKEPAASRQDCSSSLGTITEQGIKMTLQSQLQAEPQGLVT